MLYFQREYVPKPIPTVKPDEPDKNEKDEDEEESNIRTVKTQLKPIIRKDYREAITAVIVDRSIQATKICALGSLLFLNKVQHAFDNNHIEFLEQNCETVIRECFYGVLHKNIYTTKMMPEFRQISNRLDEQHRVYWPNADNFGNGMNDLTQTYVTNTKTNLYTHRAKRFREFLRMKIFQLNQLQPQVVHYDDNDINNVIDLAIYGKDSIEIKNSMDDVAKRERRTILLQLVTANSWWDIPYNNISRFTKKDWFKSIGFWISLQRHIDVFNTDETLRLERQLQRKEYQEQQRCRRRNHRHPKHPCKCKDIDQGQLPNNEYTEKGPPKVKNLSVLPILLVLTSRWTISHCTIC